MDVNEILERMLQDESQYFYRYVRSYDEKRLIDIVMADDVLTTILKYDMCTAQREAVRKAGSELNDRNGTVIFAPSKEKITLVVLSKKVLPNKDLDEVRGTISHELTHAHDFYDFVDFLQISDYNEAFNSPYYDAFFFWTEFHARRIGYRRFIEHKFIKSWKQFKKHRFEFLEGIKANFLIHSKKGRIYDLMQTIGRYSTYIDLCSSHQGNFKEDILEDTVKPDEIDIINDIYCLLVENKEFNLFINNILQFDDLIKKLESM